MGAFYAVYWNLSTRKPVRYRDAGVNIDEADRAVSAIKKLARQTFTAGVLTDIGSFGASYQLAGFRKPVLVSSADGVGTKLKVAFLTGRHDTVGEDLVNHCVNDIAVQGAVPLFFLDYFAVGKLDARRGRGGGLRDRARLPEQRLRADRRRDRGNAGPLRRTANTTWPASSWAPPSASELLTGKTIRAGDVLLGLPSTGLHTNGYSLARKLLFEVAGYGPKTLLPEVGATVGDALLKVHRSYLKPIRALMAAGLLRGAAHITGGGITDNTPRMLPEGLGGGDRHRVLADSAAVRAAAPHRRHPGGRLPAHVQPGRRHDPGGAGARRRQGRSGCCASWARRRSASATWSQRKRGRPRVEYR